MFATATRSLLFVVPALFATLALAAPFKGVPLSAAAGGEIAVRDGGSRFTYYDAGENACGSTDSNTAYIIALSPAQFNNGAHCYKKVTVEYDGQQVEATVTDECPGCQGTQADLSRPLFAHLAPTDEGVIYGNWWFN
ncbi:RlpA-like double-psi beta-barrel-protein domain-containing protein-containing protein [Dichomitus squalens]|uniref:RlpA-like double-psi beta-barrel-protein domain-containing protein-containing protein n=1 Tax=Dichomitus squalens TaxID=114155 RepID=A0A4Q9P794_9APHY|nr:RlpA-like double-psi beta-barrel-protein domain-containing protein-containing protein [Dichomitus squalens]TBU47976.1 RlpA-like double-psi beta-barrel-protein domain-containing protein-containing protein [Dichomitus squalens]